MLALLTILALAAPGPMTREQVPEPLKAWVPWVMRGEEHRACPFLHGGDTRECLWPGRLQLSLDEKGGKFTQRYAVYADGFVALPGDATRWPQEVKADGKPAVVVPLEEEPVVWLTAGEHQLTGEFFWDSLPEALALPQSTGLLALTLRGKPVLQPNRDDDGRVFLQKDAAAAESENLEITVSRLVTDDIPLLLNTRIELDVSGKSREVLLGRALPDGFEPMSLESRLPMRVEPDGKLRLQVRPGHWSLTLVARHDGPVAELKRPDPQGPWQQGDETWAFDARAELRQVLIENVPAVDPTQTRLPAEWKRLPAYSMSPTDVMKLTERRRGDSDPAPDTLALSRTLWLDFDGTGYTVADKVTGELRRSWRLQMQPRTVLGRVVASGADQSITRLKGSTSSGVELRQGNLALESEERIEGDIGRIPAVSWDSDFHQVSALLQLPAGWRLFHASGADDVSQTWVHDWTLLDIFLVLILAVAIGRLFGVRFGVLALITLTLTFRETDAPYLSWLFVLAGEALVRVLPESWVRKAARLYRLGAWAALVLIAVTFMVQHVRHGLYPALERNQSLGGVQAYSSYLAENNAQYARSSSKTALEGWVGSSNGLSNYDGKEDESGVALDQVQDAARAPQTQMANAAPMKQQAVAGKKRSFNVRDFDKNAMVQTGPGLPRWEWNPITFRYSGPVEKSQQLSLWLIPPSINRLLAFLRVALLALLVLCVIGFPGAFWPRMLKGIPAVAALLLAVFLLKPAAAFAADVPDADALTELRNRLTANPQCAPTCASSPRLSLEVTPGTLRIRFEVLAQAATAVPLPGNSAQWAPDDVLVDGKPAAALRRAADGVLWLAVTAGVHQVVLQGAIPARDTVQISLPLPPHRVDAKLDGWTIEGLHEDGLADDNLQLSRVQGSRKGQTALQTGTLPPFVRVERELSLGLQWTVQTTVIRLTPSGSAVVLEVPLLPGESVTGDTRVQNGRALINMSASTNQVSWSSVLQEKTPIVLEAPKSLPWVEVWRLDISPVWHARLSGIPVVHQQDATGARMPEWRPWPGETATIDVERPESVQGQTATIDQSQLRVRPGVRATDCTLTFNLRASRGGLHPLTLPDDAQLQTVTINGATQPIRQEGRIVSLPLIPGSQSVVVTWRQTSGISGVYATPEVKLGTQSVNADLVLELPTDRWVLFATGPRMGPAVLFWSWLLVLLVVSIGLSRIPWTPLKARHWLLLAIGLSQVPMAAIAFVFAWLVVMGWRQKYAAIPGGWALFNLRQLALIGFTFIALIILGVSIYQGLLGVPDMQVSGNGSHATQLHWFADRAADAFPRGHVFSVPMLVYRGAMLVWSLWLAVALLSWLKWAWAAFGTGGLWQKAPPPAPRTPKPPPATVT